MASLRISKQIWDTRTPEMLHTNHVRTVVLVVCLAELALQAGTDLSAHTNTVSNLNGCHLIADFYSLANDFMTDADGKRAITPTASDGMNIRAADSAAFNFDVDITVFELLRFELRIYSAMFGKRRKIQWVLTSSFSKSLHLF